MSIERIRASLKDDALKDFDNTLSKLILADNVDNRIIDFKDARNFIVKAQFDTKPHTGLVIFEDGKITGTYCC